jgi:uncharacterized repeat protein (TIGR03803 family)
MKERSAALRGLAGIVLATILSGCADNAGTSGSLHAVVASGRSSEGSEQVLYSFTGGSDGGNAATGLAFDNNGNLYGTTVTGGTSQCGTIFKLMPPASPPWQESVLHSFSCYTDGKNPHGGASFDRSGNLDGTTVAGGSGGSCGSDGCGVLFQLTPQTENVLHDFTAGRDGFGPGGGVVFDPSGNIYGMTPDGGSHSEGTIYEVWRAGRKWHEKIIHAFTGGADGGVGSLGLLLRDTAGNLYGVAEIGGAHGAGTVFRLHATSRKRWRLTTLYAFKGQPDSASPYGGLVADPAGDLFGTTYYGGAAGLGSVFELARRSHGPYRERVLYSFQGGSDGSSPTATLILQSGELYGTTSAGGGSCGCGTLFEVDARSGDETVLHAFGNGSDGAYPYYGLTLDARGNFYGATVAGGAFGQGSVYEFTP